MPDETGDDGMMPEETGGDDMMSGGEDLPLFSFFVTSYAAITRLSGTPDGFGGDLGGYRRGGGERLPRSARNTGCDPLSERQGERIAGEAAHDPGRKYHGSRGGWDLRRVPEAGEGGNIALIEEGDIIEIDIPNRAMNVKLTDAELAERRAAMEARDNPWTPSKPRARKVSRALRVYAAHVGNASH